MRAETLVIQTAFLGDVVLTTPLLSVLGERHGSLDVVTTPAAAPLLETHPAVAEVIPYDKRGADRGAAGLWRLGRRLSARRYARVYLPHGSWRSAGLALLSGASERTGFADSPAAVTYTTRVPAMERGHQVERLVHLAGPVVGAPPAVSIALTFEERAAVGAWLGERGLGPGFLALAPGSIWGTKRWPYFAELAAAVDRPIVVLGSADDAGLAAEILAAAPGRAHSAAGVMSLRAAAALLEQAGVLVTNDSAPLHLATAVGTPIVALFGPTVPAFGFGPRGPRDLVVEHDRLSCRPCSSHGPRVCPLGHHRCMRELSVERVRAAIAAVTAGEVRGAIRSGH
ncbi:MAG TPA: lipopolysaccharide heptosyltransferase II [Gemmatimonadales bacterium]|jgi:heptosyltransferase-2|nr:lipopolysaccharide heptosyltransferase II [Gemmatimonadales bacterium]